MKNRRSHLVYLFLGLAYTVCTSMIYPILPVYYVQEVGMNPLQLVLVGTTLEATILLFEIPTGVVADTYGRRLSVIVGEVLIGTGWVIQGSFPSFALVLLAAVIRGVGDTFISGALDAWIADEVGEEHLAQAYLRYGQARRVGFFAGIGVGVALASIQLGLPILVGGVLILVLALVLMLVMPEQGFRPVPREDRSSWQLLRGTFRDGVVAVRRQPTLLRLFAITAFFGAHSEGIDRLWEAHLLAHFRFPSLGTFKPIVWFGILQVATGLATLLVAEVAVRRLDINDRRRMVPRLILLNALIVGSVVTIGLAGSFWLAVGAFLATAVLKTLYGPIYRAWLNRHVSSRVRATVLSMNGQADALGQFVGGPATGVIGTLLSLRAALVASGSMFAPALLLYRGIARQV